MRRTPAAIAAAAAGLAGVLAFNVNGSRSALQIAPKSGPTTTANPSSPTTSAPPSGAVRSAVGATEQFGYGTIAVKVTVRGTHILDVSVASIQTAEPYSQQLAQQVIPLLRSQVLAAQSARINGISGATYTSEGYAYSLQAALDKLHA